MLRLRSKLSKNMWPGGSKCTDLAKHPQKAQSTIYLSAISGLMYILAQSGHICIGLRPCIFTRGLASSSSRLLRPQQPYQVISLRVFHELPVNGSLFFTTNRNVDLPEMLTVLGILLDGCILMLYKESLECDSLDVGRKLEATLSMTRDMAIVCRFCTRPRPTTQNFNWVER